MNKEKIIHFLNNFEVYLCDILMMLTTVVATAAVFCRYVLNDSIIWAEEVCRFSFVWVSLLSCGYAVNNSGHLIVDVLTPFEDKLPSFITKGLEVIVTAIWLGFCIFFAIQGWTKAFETTQISSALEIPMTFIYLAIPVGCIIMGVRIIQKCYWDLAGKRKEKEDGKEAEE